jgi:hypothetical protein
VVSVMKNTALRPSLAISRSLGCRIISRLAHTNKLFDFNFEVDPMESSKSLHGFDPSSRKKDPFNVTESPRSQATTTEKERMIFANLVDSLLAQKSTGDSETLGDKTETGSMSKSLHALFEQTFSKPSLGSSGSSSVDVATEEWRKNLPLSFAALSKAKLDPQAGDREGRERYSRLLEPVLNHISELRTDVEVTQYYTTKILDRYNEETEMDSIDESYRMDVENPPLVRPGLSLYLVKCMSILNETFHDPAGAIALFELSKKNGITFYASTCTVDVYNKMLQIKWVYYRDLYSIEALLLEMLVNAVIGDSQTIDLLNDISHQSIDAKHSVSGLESMPLWSKEDDLMIENISRYRMKFMANLANRDGYDFL